jgi:trehalose 6-phosphate phosphatase
MKEPPFSGRTPVFVGDDVTDEDGFRVVNELGGVSVKVDAGPSCASFRLPDTKAVLDWIDQLLARGRT